jgi:tRNA(fMet)-specific endonuclease VapC
MSVALLDTDLLSEVIKLRDATVRKHALAYVQQHGALAFSAFTRYEVLRGYKQQGATRQLANFAVFCQHAIILPVTDAIWDRTSDLWAFARLNGHPHDDADLVIAATALEYQRTLVKGNLRHFAWIHGLTIVDWRQP